jgi:hypothetical protein
VVEYNLQLRIMKEGRGDVWEFGRMVYGDAEVVREEERRLEKAEKGEDGGEFEGRNDSKVRKLEAGKNEVEQEGETDEAGGHMAEHAAVAAIDRDESTVGLGVGTAAAAATATASSGKVPQAQVNRAATASAIDPLSIDVPSMFSSVVASMTAGLYPCVFAALGFKKRKRDREEGGGGEDGGGREEGGEEGGEEGKDVEEVGLFRGAKDAVRERAQRQFAEHYSKHDRYQLSYLSSPLLSSPILSSPLLSSPLLLLTHILSLPVLLSASSLPLLSPSLSGTHNSTR